MKVPAKGESKFLAKEDLDHPVSGTMAKVAIERVKGDRGDEEKYILYFQERWIKPMILNVTNRKRIIAAFGDESDLWIGKVIEVYVDPNVEMGGEIVGGVRVKVAPTQEKFPGRSSDVWPFDKALEECAKANITKDDLIAALKALGNSAYNAARDTPHVQHLIAIRSQQSDIPLNEGPDTGGDIPF